jgi:hypothetical protein
MADQRAHRQGFTPDDMDGSGWICVPALSAVNGEDFGPDIPLGFDPVGAPGTADSRALRRRGDRVAGAVLTDRGLGSRRKWRRRHGG